MLFVAGIDEAGRGPLAGPVTAACVVLPAGFESQGIADSKKLSPKRRAKYFDRICAEALVYQVVSVGQIRIDSLNIRQATIEAMSIAASKVAAKLAQVHPKAKVTFLIDGDLKLPLVSGQEAIVKGDSKIVSIAAASILAKVTRDRLMEKLESYYPGYGFASHKGYPTREHKSRIELQGPSRVHRKSFAGVQTSFS